MWDWKLLAYYYVKGSEPVIPTFFKVLYAFFTSYSLIHPWYSTKSFFSSGNMSNVYSTQLIAPQLYVNLTMGFLKIKMLRKNARYIPLVRLFNIHE